MARRWCLVKDTHGRGRARMGAAYQSLPTAQTKPKTNGSCMCLALPNLTGFRARGAKPLVLLAWSRCPYHSLPSDRSGSPAVPVHLYQPFPAATIQRLYATIIRILLFHTVPTRLCPIHPQQVPQVDRAEGPHHPHRQTPHRVADPHAAARCTRWPDRPTTTPNGCYRPIIVCEAI